MSGTIQIRRAIIRIGAGITGLVWLVQGAGLGHLQHVHWNHKVYVALGFHGNLYHSFRGDSNDDQGFGRDIRIIRRIISTLDRFNRQGIPVRGSWEFDNYFSLENILPRFAPDILSNLKRRIGQGTDEIMVMSYNNGMASAMTARELTRSVQWAVSNPWGSGVQDLFGTYTPVVRPQEMMTTPGNFDVYRQAGIQAVALYYSATPFDAFRLFTRPLTREQAHNPLAYRNKDTAEQMLVIPAYNIGDLVENVSLGHWVNQLHRLQRSGQIRRDVLVYINFDADSEYWTGADQLKWPLTHLPNTRGLSGLIQEVADKNFVRFTTVKDYLKDHGPAGEIQLGQDTADGSFDGYNSWSEKWKTTQDWTRILNARRIENTASKVINLFRSRALADRLTPLMDEAFRLRLSAMSTTHFGMSTPFVAPGREDAMADILDRLDRLGVQIDQVLDGAVRQRINGRRPGTLPRGSRFEDTLVLVNPDAGAQPMTRFVCLPAGTACVAKGRSMMLVDERGRAFPLVPLPVPAVMPGGDTDRVRTFYIESPRPVRDGVYFLCTGSGSADTRGSQVFPEAMAEGRAAVLKNRFIELGLDTRGTLTGLTLNGTPILAPGGAGPYVKYRGDRLGPGPLTVHSAGGRNRVSVESRNGWQGPADRSLTRGHVAYTLSLIQDLPCVFVSGTVEYPATMMTDIFKSDLPGLARPVDFGWQETAPFEIALATGSGENGPVRILKNNFMDVDSTYDINYFRHSLDNLTLDNVNNQITGGYVGVADGSTGMALSFDPQVAANFAGVPVKIRQKTLQGPRRVSINPFGTYYGSQNIRPTWGNGQGHEASLISGEQYHSAAPTFNGKTTRFSLMLAPFQGQQLPEATRRLLKAYARPARALGTGNQNVTCHDRRVMPRVPFQYEAAIDNGRLNLSWSGDNGMDYVVRMGTKSGNYPFVFRPKKGQIVLDGLSPLKPFRSGQRLYAVIEATGPGGDVPVRTPEIQLHILDSNRIDARTKIPWQFPLKVIWANLKSAFLN